MNPQMAYFSIDQSETYKPYMVNMDLLVSATLTRSLYNVDSLTFSTTQKFEPETRILVKLNGASGVANDQGEFVVLNITEEFYGSSRLYTYECPCSLWYDLAHSAVAPDAVYVDSSGAWNSNIVGKLLERTAWKVRATSVHSAAAGTVKWGHVSAWEALEEIGSRFTYGSHLVEEVTISDGWKVTAKQIMWGDCAPSVAILRWIDPEDPTITVTKHAGNSPTLRRVYPRGRGDTVKETSTVGPYGALDYTYYVSNGADGQANRRGSYLSPSRTIEGNFSRYQLDAYADAPEDLTNLADWPSELALKTASQSVSYDINFEATWAPRVTHRVRLGTEADLVVYETVADIVNNTITCRAHTAETGSTESAPAIATTGNVGNSTGVGASDTARNAEVIKDCTITVPSTAPHANASTLTTSVTLDGYTPVGVAGYKWDSGTRQNFFHIYRLDVDTNGTVTISVCNFHDTDNANGVIRIYVLMARNDTLSS